MYGRTRSERKSWRDLLARSCQWRYMNTVERYIHAAERRTTVAARELRVVVSKRSGGREAIVAKDIWLIVSL